MGCAVLPRTGGICVVQEFFRLGTRFACGVAYCDLDGDEFYDVGEGLGEAVADGRRRAHDDLGERGVRPADPSGDAGRVTLAWEGFTATRAFPEGGRNAKLDLRITPPVVAAMYDTRMRAVEEERAARPLEMGWQRLALRLHRMLGLGFLDPPRGTGSSRSRRTR